MVRRHWSELRLQRFRTLDDLCVCFLHSVCRGIMNPQPLVNNVARYHSCPAFPSGPGMSSLLCNVMRHGAGSPRSAHGVGTGLDRYRKSGGCSSREVWIGNLKLGLATTPWMTMTAPRCGMLIAQPTMTIAVVSCNTMKRFI